MSRARLKLADALALVLPRLQVVDDLDQLGGERLRHARLWNASSLLQRDQVAADVLQVVLVDRPFVVVRVRDAVQVQGFL